MLFRSRLKAGQGVQIDIDAMPGRRFGGKVEALDSQLDANGRSVLVRARIANAGGELRAGMFAQVEVQLPESQAVVSVPATAIAYASYGNSVFVVEKMKDDSGHEYTGVRQQFVKLGPTRGDLIGVMEGLKPGDQVVTAGVFKLRNGAAVQGNNSVQPASSPAPKPANT